MLVLFHAFNGLALRPVVGLVCFWRIGQGLRHGKAIRRHRGSRVRIAVVRVRFQIIGIMIDGAGLPLLVLGPGVLGRVGDGDDALPLVVQDFAHIHIKGGIVRHGNQRRAVRRQNPAVAGAGDLARQIDLAPRGVDVLHKELVRGGIPIDLGHIVKDFVRAIPLSAAVVDLVHGTVLDDGCFSGGTPLRRSQLLVRHRGGVVLVAALDQAVHVDIGSGHIDIPSGDVARSRLGGIRTRVVCRRVAGLIAVLVANPSILWGEMLKKWITFPYIDSHIIHALLSVSYQLIVSVRRI